MWVLLFVKVSILNQCLAIWFFFHLLFICDAKLAVITKCKVFVPVAMENIPDCLFFCVLSVVGLEQRWKRWTWSSRSPSPWTATVNPFAPQRTDPTEAGRWVAARSSRNPSPDGCFRKMLAASTWRGPTASLLPFSSSSSVLQRYLSSVFTSQVFRSRVFLDLQTAVFYFHPLLLVSLSVPFHWVKTLMFPF